MPQQVFLPAEGNEPTQIRRWKPSGKIWEESNDNSSEGRLMSVCAGLAVFSNDPTTKEDEFNEILASQVRKADDGREGTVLEMARDELADLANRLDIIITPYEAWWVHTKALLYFKESLKAGGEGGKSSPDDILREIDDIMESDKDHLWGSYYVMLVWNMILERLSRNAYGMVAVGVTQKAMAGDVGAVNTYFRAFRPQHGIVRTENSLQVSGSIESIDPLKLSEEEATAERAKLMKSLGLHPEDSMKDANFTEDDDA